MSESKSICELVVITLSEMGVRWPDAVIETLLVRDGCFVGHVFRYDGGHATWWLGSPTIDFHDENGELVKMVSVAAARREDAA